MRRAMTLAILIFALAGCQKADVDDRAQHPALTEAQRDSAVAASSLPGASVLGRALGVADSAKVRAARENAAAR